MPDEERKRIEIRPQPRQAQACSSPADIIIYGGSAFGGKTIWLTWFEALRHINVRRFYAVIFRRISTEITNPGGMWDEAGKIYPALGGVPNLQTLTYTFPKYQSKVKFSYLQYITDLQNWRGPRVPFIGFDQLEMFESEMFWYMMTRNGSAVGIKPVMRATVNPEPCWLCDWDHDEKTGLISWWIADDGYPIIERSGVLRWFVKIGDEVLWADTFDECISRYGKKNLPANDPLQVKPKSLTFILATIWDNKIGMTNDPTYISNLESQDTITRERLLGDPARGGNWRVRAAAGKIFNKDWFEVITFDRILGYNYEEVRFWDLAATEKQLDQRDPDFTASVKMRFYKSLNLYVVVDCTAKQIGPAAIDKLMLDAAEADGVHCKIRWEEQGGADGKRETYHTVTMLRGYDADGVSTLSKDKFERARPLATQSEHGNVKVLYSSAWNSTWINHLHGAEPGMKHDDIMDASSGAFTTLTYKKKTARAL